MSYDILSHPAMADKWSQIPAAQLKRVGDTVTSEVIFFGITAGILTVAVAIMLLTIWMFYWVRKRSCNNLIKGAANCATAFYQASINNTVLGLAGMILICTCAVTCRLIFLRHQTKQVLNDLAKKLKDLESELITYILDNAKTYKDSWGLLSSEDRAKAVTFIKSLVPATDGHVTTVELNDALNKLQSLKEFVIFAVQGYNNTYDWATWFKKWVPKGSTATWAQDPQA